MNPEALLLVVELTQAADCLFEEVIGGDAEKGYDGHEESSEYDDRPFDELEDAGQRLVVLRYGCLYQVESSSYYGKQVVGPADHGDYVGDDVDGRECVEAAEYSPDPGTGRAVAC